MADLISAKPRTWHEIVEHFTYELSPAVLIGQFRHELGRMADERPNYPYTFSDMDFVYGDGEDSASKTAKSVAA